MSFALTALLCFASPSSTAEPAPLSFIRLAEDWTALEAEWQSALTGWARANADAKAAKVKRSDRPPHPAAAFWPRFVAAAQGGEARAVLWMCANLREAWPKLSDRSEHANEILSLVERTAATLWVADVLPALVDARRELDAARLTAVLEKLAREDQPLELRIAARLVHADLIERDDAPAASKLRLQAVELRLGSEGTGERSREQLDELARALREELDAARSRYFDAAYEKGEDAVYVQRKDAPPDPQKTYRPLLESLADEGSGIACAWVLSNTPLIDKAAKDRARACLTEVAQAGLPKDAIQDFAYTIEPLTYGLGANYVEPRIVELAANSPEEGRPTLLAGLGEALCATAGDDEAQRERGLVHLRALAENRPDSEEGRRAKGKVFRYTNLVVGKKAPDFEAADVDGNAFKLSDYEGSVVVIDFWGFW